MSNTTPWSPSAREREREIYRKNLQARKRVIALISTVLVLGTFSAILLTSPGWDSVKTTFFDLDYGKEVFPTVIRGLVVNIQLTLIGGAAIGIIALALALLKTTKSPALTPFRFIATAYIDIFRGAPLILIILLVGFGVPALRIQGLTNNVIVLGTIAVVLTYSAYVAEVIRSGILSVHQSQRAAARSLGLTSRQTMRYVVLPQAIRRVIPPLLNDFVSLLKDTGLVSILGVTDAVRAAQINASRTFNYTPYVVAAILFLLITIPLTRFIDRQIRLRSEKQNSEGLA
uniref:amino acid ABC transporter permease n=1 Tax=Candidatus Planktophila sp. TaxID=2175601 RepID=UPI0040495C23